MEYASDELVAECPMVAPSITGTQVAAGHIYYFIKDGLGSTVAAYDPKGAIQFTAIYDAYGNLLTGSTLSSLTDFLFNGQQLDPNSGLYYLRARYYDPNNGRFLTQDPLGGRNSDPVTLHRYLYCHDDGINFVDPSGRADQNLFSLSSALAIATSFVSRICAVIRVGIYTRPLLAFGLADGAINAGVAFFDPNAPPMPSGIPASAIEGAAGNLGGKAVDALIDDEAYLGTELRAAEEDASDASNYLYRVLRADEDISDGITAKAPDATTSVRNHVRLGSRQASQWISTFKDESKAIERAKADGGLRVVKIDTTQVTNRIIDLTDPEVMNVYFQENDIVSRRYARKSTEVLVERHIPANALTLLPY